MKALPTLSVAGWVEAPATKADKLLSYFFTNQWSQSIIHRGHIQSLTYLVATFANDPAELQYRVTESVTALLKPFFDDIEIGVGVNEEDGKRGTYEIKIDAMVTDGETRALLGKLVNVADATIVKIKDLNNGT